MQRSLRFITAAALVVCALTGATVVATDHPPGLSAEGVTDAEALLDAHEATLVDTSYTYDYRYVRRAPNGTLLERRRTHAQVAADGRFNATHSEAGPLSSGPDTSTYANGSVVYTLIRQNGNVTYARAPSDERSTARERFLTTWFMQQMFNNTDVVVERVERNGTAVYDLSTPSPSAASFPGYEVTNLSVQATVSGAGVVREFRASYGIDGDRVLVYRSYAVVGTTEVERPPWLSAAIESATEAGDRPSVAPPSRFSGRSVCSAVSPCSPRARSWGRGGCSTPASQHSWLERSVFYSVCRVDRPVGVVGSTP